MVVGLAPDRAYTDEELREMGPTPLEEVDASTVRTFPEGVEEAERQRQIAERQEAIAMRRFRRRAKQRLKREQARLEAEERQLAAERALWQPVESDAAFGALFVGAEIVEAVATLPAGLPRIEGDVFWRFSDGRWLTLRVEVLGCITCDHETEKHYHVLPPDAARTAHARSE